ncbi:STP4 [Candida oxycetoniae]|uniref:STP4 n=1 Tax=Candida oxycetoniae TaxID=497107 RepID=A0AAI9SXL0_9ASCO|nr:STP4 [Candida oxycetoniae]KAI3404720.2 STP4 [Candida oxycetoniae]
MGQPSPVSPITSPKPALVQYNNLQHSSITLPSIHSLNIPTFPPIEKNYTLEQQTYTSSPPLQQVSSPQQGDEHYYDHHHHQSLDNHFFQLKDEIKKEDSLPSLSPESKKNWKPRKKRQCSECKLYFSNLATHKSTHLKPTNRPHICEYCQRGFARPNDLFRHTKCHWKEIGSDKGQFKCPFKSQSNSQCCHNTGIFSRCDTFKNHLKAIHFQYPNGTKKEQRSKVKGKCRLCQQEFENVDDWIKNHINSKSCPMMTTATKDPTTYNTYGFNSPKDLFSSVTLESRVSPFELDMYLHKSNSTYFLDLDIARTKLLIRLLQSYWWHSFENKSGKFGKSKRKIANFPYAPIAIVKCQFKRELKPFEKFHINSRILAWDKKWLFVLSTFTTKNSHNSQMDKVNAVALTKYVFKIGRITIPPIEILNHCNLIDEKNLETNLVNYELVKNLVDTEGLESIAITAAL